jgi:hypothetical protein
MTQFFRAKFITVHVCQSLRESQAADSLARSESLPSADSLARCPGWQPGPPGNVPVIGVIGPPPGVADSESVGPAVSRAASLSLQQSSTRTVTPVPPSSRLLHGGNRLARFTSELFSGKFSESRPALRP